MQSVMSLQVSSRLHRASQRGWKSSVRHIRVGKPCRLPEKPYWRSNMRVAVKGFDEIPGPKPYLLGNIWRYSPMIGKYSFDRLHETHESLFKEYGYVVKEKVHPWRTIVHLYHPEDIMTVYNCIGRYPLRRSHTAMEKYRRERPHLYPSAGLGASNGEEWRQFREMFKNILTEKTVLEYPTVREQYYNATEDVTADLVVKLGEGVDAKGEIDVRQPFFRWALESIALITLNQRIGCLEPAKNDEADRLIQAAHTTHDVIYKTENRLSPFLKVKQYKRLVEAQDYFTNVIRKYIDLERAASKDKPSSMLSLLLSKTPNQPEIVITLLLDLIQGGIHPVSYTLCFALLHLAKNKDKQDKLRKELISELPTKTTSMREVDAKLPYLDLVIKETLRLNPPTIGTGRILDSDILLGGYKVPSGTMVLLHNQVTSLQEEFFKDARVFNPERFTEEQMLHNSGISSATARFAYMPFGYDARACIGSTFALMELRFAIAKIVRNYEISYHHSPVGIINKLHNQPDKPVLLRLKKVEN